MPRTLKGKSACQEWLQDHVEYDKDDCLIWPFSSTRGYGHFKCNGVRSYAHRYMCTLVHGEPPSDEHQASHSCGKGHQKCVSPRHVSWKTPSGNQLDRRLHGTTKRNKNGPKGKITMGQAEEIRKLWPEKTQDELAKLFGVSRSNIQFILAGQTKLRAFGLERQRIIAALAKAQDPMGPHDIRIAARLSTVSATNNMLMRMIDAGEIIRLGYGAYTLPSASSSD